MNERIYERVMRLGVEARAQVMSDTDIWREAERQVTIAQKKRAKPPLTARDIEAFTVWCDLAKRNSAYALFELSVVPLKLEVMIVRDTANLTIVGWTSLPRWDDTGWLNGIPRVIVQS